MARSGPLAVLLVPLAVLLVSLALGCDADEHWYFKGEPHEHRAEWSYAGATGPRQWGELDPSYAPARDGRAQSPIDLPEAGMPAEDAPALEFRYRFEPARFVNNGHTLQHDEETESWLSWGQKRYAL